MMKKGFIFYAVVMLFPIICAAQGDHMQQQRARKGTSDIPVWAVKSNLLYDATTTFNLGTEFRLSRRYSLDISGNYNPWTFSDNKKFKHVLVQPELRYWLCESFFGHFFGLHLLYSHYNIGGINMPGDIFPALEKNRYQGDLYGAGLGYGYHKVLSSRWSLEFELGVGYVYTSYKEYDCKTCGAYKGTHHKNYFAPTKAAISLVYMIK
jgi:hypothetical protein